MTALGFAAVIGRTRERGELEAVPEGARTGRSAALAVHGEAGIGKSTLLDEVIAAAPDFRVLRARGYESESDIPFAALLDLFTPVLDLLDRIPRSSRSGGRRRRALARRRLARRRSCSPRTGSPPRASCSCSPCAPARGPTRSRPAWRSCASPASSSTTRGAARGISWPAAWTRCSRGSRR